MLATILVYSLFITNPTGTLGPHAASREHPYFFYQESQMREYSSMDKCEAVATTVKDDLNKSLNKLFMQANTASEQADYRIKQAKYGSIKCLEVKRTIDTDKANTVEGAKQADVATVPTPAPEIQKASDVPEQVVAFRIGRMDAQHQFHGTDYNKVGYSSMDKCRDALAKTQTLVATKAVNEGADQAGLIEVMNKFTSTYGCVQVWTDDSERLDVMPVVPKLIQRAAPREPIVQEEAAPTVAQEDDYYPPEEPNAQIQYAPPANMVQRGVYSGRRYTISELVYLPNGMTSRINYGSYPSVVMCNQALQQMLAESEQRIHVRYRYNQTMAGYDYYRRQLYDLQQRRGNMSCVA